MNVDFKPTKKMKKRRELDALVTHTKSTGHRRKKGQHELLVNDSESSELEEFSIPQKQALRKRGACRFCGTCVTVCGVFLLMACIAAIAGLVWVHIELKRELDQLQLQLNKVDQSGRATPQEINAIKDKQTQLSKSIETWQDDISHLQASVTSIISQLSNLNKTTASFSQSLATAQEFAKLPDNVNSLSRTVAEQGSILRTATDDIKYLKNKVSDLEAAVQQSEEDAGQATTKSSTLIPTSPSSSSNQPQNTAALDALDQYVNQEVKRLTDAVNSVNNTFITTVGQMKANSENHKISLIELFNKTSELEDRLSFMELTTPSSSGGISTQQVNAIVQAAMNNQSLSCTEAVNNLKNQTDDMFKKAEIKMQAISSNVSYAAKRLSSVEQTVQTMVINFGLEKNPSSVAPPQDSHLNEDEGVHHTYENLSNQVVTTQTSGTATREPYRTYEDLQAAFKQWDDDGDGLVNEADIGADAQGIDLAKYDQDRDGMYSLSELQQAFNVMLEGSDDQFNAGQKRSLTDEDVQDLLSDMQSP